MEISKRKHDMPTKKIKDKDSPKKIKDSPKKAKKTSKKKKTKSKKKSKSK